MRRIYSGPDIHRIIEDLDEVIGKNDPRIFQRTGHLVIVRGMLPDDAKRLRLTFDPQELIIVGLKRDSLLPVISEHVDYGTDVSDGDEGTKWKQSAPNADVTASFLVKRFWAYIRSLRNVSKTPVIHFDGAIVSDGYDPKTKTLVASNVALPELPERVSLVDASKALAELIEPFSEFHFASETNRYASATLILTLLLRPSIAGNVPLFIFRAPQKDCGKSLVAKVACLIATGSIPAANTWSEEKDEQEKVLSSVAVAGLPVCFFDNVSSGGIIGGGPLDGVATCDGEKGFRVLGHTEQRTMPWSTVIVFTSNRARIEGDTDRRSVVVELTRRAEAIERFAHDDLIEYVRRHRARLLGAAFTLVRGWVQAGRPLEGVKRLSSFEEWGRTVPSIIKWATKGAIDVRTLVPDSQGTEADEVEFTLLQSLHAYLAAENLGSISVNVLVSRVISPTAMTSGLTDAQREIRGALKEAIDAMECTVGRGEHATFSSRRFGKKLSAMADVFYHPYRLQKVGSRGNVAQWSVTSIAAPVHAHVNGNGAHHVEPPPVSDPVPFDPDNSFADAMADLGVDSP